MKVMSMERGGASLAEIPTPEPGPGEIRIRVVASSINPAEEKIAAGELVGKFLHGQGTPLVLGYDLSGVVDAVGAGVDDLREGDAVFGHLAYSRSTKFGAFAEFAVTRRDAVALVPEGLPPHIAAASPTVCLTALQSLRDRGRLQRGGRVLVIGAGGGIGAVAVGITKRLGAAVTAVCSTKDVERVAALGADEVIDRTRSDPLAGESKYDVVFDTPAVHSYGQCARLLAPGGAYVTTLPGLGLLTGKLMTLFSSKRCEFVAVESRREDLELVAGWIADGMEVPIDSRHRIGELDDALARQADRQRAGKVVVDITDGW